MSNEQTAEELVIIAKEDVETVRGIAADHGVTATEVTLRKIEPITTITLILIGGATAVAAVMNLIEQHKGGQVIDLRSNAPRIVYRTKDVIYGLIIIFTSDGKVLVEVKEPRTMAGQVMSTVNQLALGLANSGTKQVADATREQLGSAATVTIQDDQSLSASSEHKGATVIG